MELIICQNCGYTLRQKSNFCHGCGIPISQYSPTPISTLSGNSRLTIELKPDFNVLEHTISKLMRRNGNEKTSNESTAHNSESEGLSQKSSRVKDLDKESIVQHKESELPQYSSAEAEANLEWGKSGMQTMQPFEQPAPVTVPAPLSTTSFLEAEHLETTPDTNSLPDINLPVSTSTMPAFDQTTFNMPLSSTPSASFRSASGTDDSLSSAPTTSPMPVTLMTPSQTTLATNVQSPIILENPAPLSNQNTNFITHTHNNDFFSATKSAAKATNNPTINSSSTMLEQRNSIEADIQLQDSNTTIFTTDNKPSIIQNAIAQAASLTKPQTEASSKNTQSVDLTQAAKEPTGSTAENKPTDNNTEKANQPTSNLDNQKETLSGHNRIHDLKQAKDEKFQFAGLTLKKKVIVPVVITAFIGFIFLVLIFQLVGLQGLGNLNIGLNGSQNQPSISGKWDFAYQNADGQIRKGVMNIIQHNQSIEGWGVDFAQFQLKGTLQNNTITFNKQYFQPNGQPLTRPILYSGKIDYVNQSPHVGESFAHVSGIWEMTLPLIHNWRQEMSSLHGRWEAQLTDKQITDANTGSSSIPSASNNRDPKGMHVFFLTIALFIIAIMGTVALLSLRLFGPAGWLNILGKKEYIPSQFKSQHKRMVKELAKPLLPGGVPLGIREEWKIFKFWMPRELALTPEMRNSNPHFLVLGGGAKGKSRLVTSMIAHDMESNDRSVIVIDSDGSLIDLLMHWISSHPIGAQIAERVIIIDPTHHKDRTVCYNPLEFPEDGDLQNAASAIAAGFKAIYTEPPGAQSQWNQQTANILRNAAVLLMANGRTLTDLPVLLADNDFRDVLLEKVERIKHEKSEYTTLVEAWTNYKRLARTDQWINWIEPILNRVQPMLGDPRIRPILTEPKGDLNLKEIVENKKILLVKIPQGQLDQNANLLGSLIVTGVKQAALSLSSKKGKKHPCALYLDEFDSFIEKETFDSITSETRKLQIGFCGASKTLQDLPEDYRNKIISNVGTMAIFALVKKDGDMLGPQMFRVDGRKIKHQTISNFFNKVNTSPQFELIADEEKLSIDRVVGQEERTYFCYRVGTVAGVFHMKAPEFKDVPENEINENMIELMYSNRQEQPE